MYVPPELFPVTPAVFNGHKSDLWRFASIAFILLTANFPWNNINLGPSMANNPNFRRIVQGQVRALVMLR